MRSKAKSAGNRTDRTLPSRLISKIEGGKKLLLVIVSFFLTIGMFSTTYAVEFAIPEEDGGAGNITLSQNLGDNYITAGNNIDIDANVGGDLVAFGNTISIKGDVEGNVITGSNTLEISGIVRHDVFAGAANVKIDKDAVIEGDLLVGSGSVSIAGEIKGKVWSASGELFISGKVGNGIKAKGGKVTLDSTAQVNGDIVYSSNNNLIKKDGASVNGEISKKITSIKAKNKTATIAMSSILSILMTLLIGALTVLLFPKFSTKISNTIKESFWSSLLWGLVALIVIPFAIIICFAIVIGMPLALILIGLYTLAIYLSKIFVGLYLGNYITKNKTSALWSMTLGVIIISLVGLIPYFGALVGLAVVLIGLGSISNTILRLTKKTK